MVGQGSGSGNRLYPHKLVHFEGFWLIRFAAMRSSLAPAAEVPVFQLYGENGAAPTPDPIHCESIAERSRLHNWEIRPHRHHGLFQLLWLEDGRAQCVLDEARLDLSGGMALMVPQHCVHGFQFSPDARGLVVTVAYSLLGALAASLSEEISQLSIACSFRLTDAAGRFETAMRALRAEYDGYDAHRSALMVAQLSIALGCLLRLSEQRAADSDRAVPARARQHVARFVALVDAAYAEQSGLEYYAGQIGISAAHLNASCRQITGQSALSIIHARSMREARRLLVYTSMTIRDVSDALGFSDPAYFTRFFKRNAGLSPRDFRLHARSWNAGSTPVSSS